MDSNSLLENSFLGSKWLNPDYLFSQGSTFFTNLFNYTISVNSQIISVYHTVLFALSLFFLTLMAYCAIRMLEIRAKEDKHLKHEIEEYAHHQAEREKQKNQTENISKNEKWIKTLNYVFSQHPSDWKLAIIEADAMLEVLLGQLGFRGATLGDKLKMANQDKFRNLTFAWEVHTIRNRIAHEGDSFQLSQHEAKRIIALYEQIFREFGFI